MFRNKFYYRIKPLLPRPVRLSIRRWFALRKRGRVSDHWPIAPCSERPPEGWSGWPDGKKFAFVLTHDVDSQAGLDKCRQLMELEMKMGFRSSFNFIPEGEYSVPRELREELTANGFEVGVHDLRHDGKLYRSRNEFRQNAARINRYLKEWGAVGFRSGFMLNNLDWLHDLDIAYDASTFDTDPFEPQPKGRNTIFPFWVPRGQMAEGGRQKSEGRGQKAGGDLNSEFGIRNSHFPAGRAGYVELPYTLPQDSTLFLLFDERTPDLWLRRLDWVAEHGGMALVNVHPDYLRFGGAAPSARTFPAAFYKTLLEYARQKYGQSFWHSLPRVVAHLVRNTEFDRRAVSPSVPVHVRNSNHKPKIWIDLDNTPHVPFFEPILEELKSRGFPLLVTARDAFQVCELADKKGLSYLKVGRHHGRNRALKAAGLVHRALQLSRSVLREKPVLGVSHGARSQLLLGNWLGIPTVLIEDYEYSQFPPMMRPTWVMSPDVIPDQALWCKNGHIRKYSGIKEDVYVWKFNPDPSGLAELGLSDSDLIVTVRPPATEAHYHNPESENLFERFMNRACRVPGVRIVLLPRNHKQGEVIRQNWPAWFKGDKTVIPRVALDGLNLMWHSDLVVSGGGTMNREAAALRVPVYSIFRGIIGAVDRHLSAEGRLVLIESTDDIERKIQLVKRLRKPVAEVTSKRTLQKIVDTIQEIAESTARNGKR